MAAASWKVSNDECRMSIVIRHSTFGIRHCNLTLSLTRQARTALSAVNGRFPIDLLAARTSPRRPARAGGQEDDGRHHCNTDQALVGKPQSDGQCGSDHASPRSSRTLRCGDRCQVAERMLRRKRTPDCYALRRRATRRSQGCVNRARAGVSAPRPALSRVGR